MGKISILEHSVAVKIAAGEVIDRPASVLRELLDNSIDAGSTEISVYLESSGMKEIRVTDNGSGMDREDLELCIKPHATSKITKETDLYHIMTLGFRGEALAGIAASSRLKITTNRDNDSAGYSLVSEFPNNAEIKKERANRGTTVSVKELFHNLPARKKFLKSPSAETALCKNVFFEKAVARPDIFFRLHMDGSPVSVLPPASLRERVFSSYNHAFRDLSLMHEIEKQDNCTENYSVEGVLSDPAIFRKDRRFIHVYLNGRRISDYSLIQAVTYGYSGFMPKGHFPCAVVFIENKPELVDFNIHPAKKEARLKNLPQIHHSVTEAVKSTLRKNCRVPAEVIKAPEATAIFREFDSGSLENGSLRETGKWYPPPVFGALSELTENFSSGSSKENDRDRDFFYVAEKSGSDSPGRTKEEETSASGKIRDNIQGFRYLGQLFRIFLLCEKDDSLYIIDQHAAHEKALFESYCRKKPVIQKLLVPVYLPEEWQLDSEMISSYRKAGIYIEKDDTGGYFIDSLPAVLASVKNDISAIISKAPGNSDEVARELFSTAACRAAVKGGDILSETEASAIIDAAFSLESPYCPHGRPVWKKITRQKLLEEIGRII